MTDSNILTRKQLAENLKIKERKIASLEEKGLPVITLGHKTKRYDYDKVLEWLEREASK